MAMMRHVCYFYIDYLDTFSSRFNKVVSCNSISNKPVNRNMQQCVDCVNFLSDLYTRNNGNDPKQIYILTCQGVYHNITNN